MATSGRLKVAMIGVSHWHSVYDASYLKLLAAMDVEIVGVSDIDLGVATTRAAEAKSTGFVDYRLMLQQTKPDLVVAMGRHVDMPDIIRHLLDIRVPFIMEKPWGVDIATIRALVQQCKAQNAWAAVPFMTRYTHWAERARAAYQSSEGGRPSQLVFRMIRPTAQRYVEWGSPWMLEKAAAGGGALINLGSHGFDICRFITNEEPEVVSCILSKNIEGGEVEDYAHVVLRTPSGLVVHNEVGYTMPTWPKNLTDGERKLATEKQIIRAKDGGVEVISSADTVSEVTAADYVSGHKRVLIECIQALTKGAPPPIGADECLRAGELIHASYAAATWA